MDGTKAANMLGALAIVLADDLRAGINEALGASGETAAALILIGANPGLKIAEIATALGLTHSGAVRLIDRLAAEGLARKAPGADSRTVLVRLSPKGAARRRAALARRARVLARAMALLEPAEAEAFAAAIAKLLHGLLTRPDQGHRFCRMCDEGRCAPTGCPVDIRLAELAR